MNVSRTIAEYVSRVQYEDLPASAVDAAKRNILDTLAVAWAGTAAPGSAELRELATRVADDDGATLWSTSRRVPAATAAFTNGAFAAALDYDGLHLDAIVHPAVVTLPAALAACEARGASGRELIAAFVAGTELMCRLGLWASGHSGWFYTSLYGVFGAAAAASRASGLGAGHTLMALGLALSYAGGTQQANVERTLAKRLQSAFAAKSGVEVSALAAAGLTAPSEPIEGRFGLYALYERGDPAQVVVDLGRSFAFEDIAFKKYPCCGCAHAGIEAALSIACSEAFVPDDVERVGITISPYMHRLVGGPFDPTNNPQVAAQFSVEYAVAVALSRRRFTIADIEPEAVRDPAIGRLVQRIDIAVDESWPDPLVPADVTVRLRSGREVRRRVDTFPGGPQLAMTDAELDAKARDCFAGGAVPLDADAAAALVKLVRDLERLDDVRTLTAALAAPRVAVAR